MTRSVHIVALAARTPVGLTAEGSAAAVRAGVSRVREHPHMIDAGGENLRCGLDGKLDPLALGAPRMRAFARAALAELLRKLVKIDSSKELGLLLALPETRPGFGQDDARIVQRALFTDASAGLPPIRPERAGDGHAGGFRALERAFARIATGQEELCLVAGVDSYLHGDTLDWLEADRRIVRAETRAGFSPGEGAALLALASTQACRALGLPALCSVRAVATTQEKRDPTRGAGVLGEALTEAIVRVAGTTLEHSAYVDDVYCDINGERPRVTDWGFALLRAGTWFRDGSDYTIPAGSCGDMGAASAIFNVVLAVRAWQRGYARGTRALVWGSSWQGLRGAALLERGEA